jgi:Domain of unknown function (DUF1918)
MSGSDLKASPGDRLVVSGHHQGEAPRDCEVIAVLGKDGGPPYEVRWEDDGHVSRLYPGSDVHVHHFEHPPEH